MYSRGSLAAKIDLRSNKAPMLNAVKLALPLTITLLLLILIYALIFYNIIPIGNNILSSAVDESGKLITFTVTNAFSTAIRILFLNITGFLTAGITDPLILLISPAVVMLGSCVGYYFGKRKIYLLDVFIKTKNIIADKFNE